MSLPRISFVVTYAKEIMINLAFVCLFVCTTPPSLCQPTTRYPPPSAFLTRRPTSARLDLARTCVCVLSDDW